MKTKRRGEKTAGRGRGACTRLCAGVLTRSAGGKGAQPAGAKSEDVLRRLEETKVLMARNVENMTRNVATAEELESGTQQMTANAQQFKKQSVALKRHYWWKNIKVCAAPLTRSSGPSSPLSRR